MPSWKKLITSGSDAAIPSISHTGDFTLDVSGDITIDADGADIILKDGGTSFGRFKRDTSDFVIKSETSNKHLLLKGNDGGATITALDLDMENAGAATFNSTISSTGLTLTSLSNQGSEATALMINGSNVVGTRELGSNAFNSTTIPTNNNQLSNGAGYITGIGSFDTDDLSQGTSNLYFSNELAQDAVGGMLTGNTETLIQVVYDDTSAKINFTVDDDLSNYDNSSSGFLTSINNSNWSGTDLAVGNGGTGASSAGDARTNLGLAIGSDVQAYDAGLNAIAGLATTDGGFIVGNGSTFVLESGSTVRTSLGLGSLATLSSINNSNWSGTDLSLANGGTGASLTDPDADRIFFWDDSAGSTAFLELGANISISGTELIASDTNTNQLTTFTLNADSGTSQTIAHGNTLTIAGGTGISSVVGATDTVTLNITDNSIGDTQLAYNTGQHLTTSSSPTFAGVTLSSLSGQASETTAVMINGSNVLGTRELGSNAFNSTTIPTNTNQLTNGAGFITATLTNEEVMDIAGPLVATGGTKTLISVTYDDSNNNMDFVVDNDLSNYDNSSSGFVTSNTNQLTTFTLTADGGSNQTIAHGNTLDIAGGTGITTTVGATDTVTVAVTDDSIGDTQLAYNTGQHLTTSSNPTFAGGTLGNIKVGVTGDNEIDTSSGNLTIDSAGGTITLDDNVVVSGNFTVSGTQTIIDSTTLNVADNIIELNAGTSDGGLYVKETSGGNATGSLLYDVSANRWVAGTTSGTANLVTISSTDTLTNKTLTSPDINGGTVDSITSLTVANNVDIGSYQLRASTLRSDVATGTAPFTVASTTAVSNLNADLLDGQHGSHYLDFSNLVIDDDEIPIAKLASDSVSFGGVSVTLGSSDATPAFDLQHATGLPIVNGTTGTLSVARGGTGATSLSSGQVLLGNGTSAIATRAIGIANDNIVEIDDADAADNDYAKFTANGLEGRSYAEVRSDLNVEDGADVTDATNVAAAGALMDSELTSISDVKALDQSVVSGASPTFGTANMTDASNKRFMSDAQETVLNNTSGTNTGDESDASTSAKGIVELATTAETTTGTDTARAVTPDGLKDGYQGSTNVTTLGTISTGTWQGSAISTTYIANTSGTNTGNSQTVWNYTLNSSGGGSVAHGQTLNLDAGNGIEFAESAARDFSIEFTTPTTLQNTSLKVGRDNDNRIDFSTDNVIKVEVNAVEDEFRFAAGGDFHADGDVIAYSSTTASDRKLKTNIQDTKYGLGDVIKLQGREFDWKQEDRGHDVGFIAQEVQEVIPELVKEVTSLKDKGTHLTVNYEKLVPVLVESIKELKQEIDDIKKKCDCLNK